MMNPAVKPTILIVEDVNADIDILSHILKAHYKLFIAKNGETALKMAEEHQPDLILLDIILPDMTGFAILEKLKDSSKTQGIPVIIITGIDNAQYEEKGLLLGAVDYITKPFHNAVVLARIKTHMQVIIYIRTIEQLGLVDTLTGLSNHRGFDNQLGLEWARAAREKTPLSLMLLEIDGFPNHIEQFGRQQSEVTLRWTATVFAGILKRPADTAFRLNQANFAVLLPNTSADGATALAEEIRNKIESLSIPGIQDFPPISITASIGGTTAIPLGHEPFSKIMEDAENCLAEAKAMGDSKILFQ